MKSVLELFLSTGSLIKLFFVALSLITLINYLITANNHRYSSSMIRVRDDDANLDFESKYLISVIVTALVLLVSFMMLNISANNVVTKKEIVVSEHVYSKNDGYEFDDVEESNGKFEIVKRVDDDKSHNEIVYSMSNNETIEKYNNLKIERVEKRIDDHEDFDNKVIVKEIAYEYFYNDEKLDVERKNDLYVTQIDTYKSSKTD